MPLFLNERQVGFNTSVIGFPDLGDCMAVVLREDGGLYGFHMMPGDVDRITAFMTYFQNRLGLSAANWTHLYGSCYRPNRYADGSYGKWKTEMSAVASAVGYQGPVSGFDTSAHGTGIKRTEATYLEYRVETGGTCTIHYKRMTKMDMASTGPVIAPGDDSIRHVVKSGASYGLGTSVGFKIPTSAQVKSTKSNQGEIHKVKSQHIDTFNYP